MKPAAPVTKYFILFTIAICHWAPKKPDGAIDDTAILTFSLIKPSLAVFVPTFQGNQDH
jgi:hypothetical protein